MASYSGYSVNRPVASGSSSVAAAAASFRSSARELFSKCDNPDPDIRFMSLCDLEELLANEKASGHLINDAYNPEMTKLATQLISMLEDQNGEVQNQALKCFGPLTRRTSPTLKPALLNRLCQLTIKPDTDSSLAFAALRLCIANMRQPSSAGGVTNEVTDDYRAIREVLLKWLLGGDNVPEVGTVSSLLSKEKGRTYSSEAIDVARDVVRIYGVLISPADLEKLLMRAMNILCDDGAGSVAIKRVLLMVQEMAPRFTEAHWDRFIKYLKAGFTRKGVTDHQRKNLISTIGMVCRGEPHKLGTYLADLTGYVLDPVSAEETMGDTDEDEDEHDAQADELKEFAFLTMDTLLSSCQLQMQPYLSECMNAALRYIKYEPNLAGFDADDEEMEDANDADFGGSDVDEDEFDDYEDADESDSDDVSWKVRRAAAKVLGTVVMTPASVAADGVSVSNEKSIYTQIVPTLLSRLTKEKEDAVKVEIVTCLVGLVKRSYKDGALDAAAADLANYDDTASLLPIDLSERMRSSRKRRRGDDDIDMITDDQFDAANDVDYEAQIAACPASFIREASPMVTSPSTSFESEDAKDFEKLISPLINALVKAWKNASLTLRQSTLVLLKTLAVAKPGALMVHLEQIQVPIKEALKSISTSTSLGARVDTGVGSASGAASVAGLCIESLGLIGVIAATYTRACLGNEEVDAVTLLTFLEDIIPGIVEGVDGRNVKVAVEGLIAIERIEKALTPRQGNKASAILSAATTVASVQKQLETLFEFVVRKIGDNNTDSDVRKSAIHVLGVVLSRTSGSQGQALLSSESRLRGLNILLDRVRSELTRVAAIKAVEDVALFATRPEDVPGPWLLDITFELAGQLRKSDRALRGSALDALKSIAVNGNTRAHLDASEESVQKLSTSLFPLLSTKDSNMLAYALVIYTKILPGHVSSVLSDEFVLGMCDVVRVSISGMTLKAFLLLVRVISEQGAGNTLLGAFLKDVGVAGDPGVLGRAIGTILVHGGPEIPVKVQDFSEELSTAEDPARKCLALGVLGEVGLRMGPKSNLSPEIFLSNFNSSSDNVRLSAAVALGNSGANNVRVYLPVILSGLQNSAALQYLLLHSLKEILHHPAKVREEVRPFAETLWGTLLKASGSVDNRAVGAACIGRLALIEPGLYLPRLKEYLFDNDAGIRSTVISAFRYTLREQNDAYREVMRPLLVSILHAMLEDPDVGNHRLALTTVNTAILHQLSLVKPQLHELVMLIIEDTKIKPELVREVQMGPFKHKVDDGLDLRKAAYEALYTSLEHSLPTLNISAVYTRLLAGISDHGDIRTLCLLMISKLITLKPVETKHHLNSLAEKFNAIMTAKQASNVVKQDFQREQEAMSGILRVTKELARAFPIVESASEYGPWNNYLEMSKTYNIS